MHQFGTENHTTEFKRQLNDALEKEVVAFLNSDKGGDLYIGVDDDGEVVGVAEPDALMLTISDRLSITSYGGLLSGLSLEECLSGRSMPRNRELMRVFRDMDLVEHLGSGMRRILNAYDSNIVHISEHFFELRFPMASEALALIPEVAESGAESLVQITAQVTAQVGLFCREPHSAKEIMAHLGLKHWKTFQQSTLNPLLAAGFIERTIPDKPQSRLQKYRLTEAGRQAIAGVAQ
jgi:ATP-dependent DNA helicase RecG